MLAEEQRKKRDTQKEKWRRKKKEKRKEKRRVKSKVVAGGSLNVCVFTRLSS